MHKHMSRLEIDIGCFPQLLCYLFSERQGFSLNLELADLAGLPSQQAPGGKQQGGHEEEVYRIWTRSIQELDKR